MLTKIQKWGHSLALRIPKAFAAEADVSVGSVVDLSINEGQMTVRPVKGRQFQLDDLLAQVKPDNLHGEIDTGEAVGREAW